MEDIRFDYKAAYLTLRDELTKLVNVYDEVNKLHKKSKDAALTNSVDHDYFWHSAAICVREKAIEDIVGAIHESQYKL